MFGLRIDDHIIKPECGECTFWFYVCYALDTDLDIETAALGIGLV